MHRSPPRPPTTNVDEIEVIFFPSHSHNIVLGGGAFIRLSQKIFHLFVEGIAVDWTRLCIHTLICVTHPTDAISLLYFILHKYSPNAFRYVQIWEKLSHPGGPIAACSERDTGSMYSTHSNLKGSSNENFIVSFEKDSKTIYRSLFQNFYIGLIS